MKAPNWANEYVINGLFCDVRSLCLSIHVYRNLAVRLLIVNDDRSQTKDEREEDEMNDFVCLFFFFTFLVK